MEKTMKEYLTETILAYDKERSSQEKYLAVFFALIDVGMAEEKLELLMQTGRGDDDAICSAPYRGVTRGGEKLFYIFTETKGRGFSDGLSTKEMTVRQICNLVAENDEVDFAVFSCPTGESVTFSRSDIGLLLQHLNSPIAP